MPGLSFELPRPPAEFELVYLVFNITRAHRIRATWSGEGDSTFVAMADEPMTDHPYPNVIRISPTKSLGLGGLDFVGRTRDVEVVVESIGEPPELVQIVYEETASQSGDREGTLWIVLPDECPTTQQPLTQDAEILTRTGSALDVVLTPESYLANLDAYFASAPDEPRTRYQKFFVDLDRKTSGYLLNLATEPALIHAAPDVKAWIQSTGGALEDRVKARLAHQGPSAPTLPSLAAGQPTSYAAQLSKWFLAVIKDQPFFFGPGGGFLLDRFEEAFEMFAEGELREEIEPNVWATQPSSAGFFQFAEFATLVIDNELHDVQLDDVQKAIDKGLWHDVLNVMVRMQEAFMVIYGPGCDPPYDPGKYVACNYHLSADCPAPTTSYLKLKYAGFNYGDLCTALTQNIQRAFK